MTFVNSQKVFSNAAQGLLCDTQIGGNKVLRKPVFNARISLTKGKIPLCGIEALKVILPIHLEDDCLLQQRNIPSHGFRA